MLGKFLVRHSHPCYGWTMLWLSLLLPSFIYTHNIVSILIIIFLSLFMHMIFPIPSEHMRKDFMYHSMRGMFLELSGEAKHQGQIYSLLLGNVWKKILILILSVLLFFWSVHLLWSENLVFGSMLFFAIVVLKMNLMSDYVNISRSHRNSEAWDALLNNSID